MTRMARVAGLVFIVMIAFALAGLLVLRRRHDLEISNELKRQEAYQTALRSFTRALPAGTKRHEVESYFRLHKIKFMQGALEDLSKIGEEPGTWFCGPPDVYLRFEFTNFKKVKGDSKPTMRTP